MCDYIVDLVSSGKTLKENGLFETEKIIDISSRLIVNKDNFLLKETELNKFLDRFLKHD